MTTPFNLASFADKVSSTGTANPSAISDIANTSTGALGFPVGTTAQRNGTPVNGMTRINSTTGVLEVYYNGSWVSIASLLPPAPTTIGQAYGGGYYAGKISTTGNGVATHYLVISPQPTGASSLMWKTTATSSAGTSSTIDGLANSNAMNDANHPAAQFCRGLTIGGYTDWYLPAQYELEVCYYFLKPTAGSNYTSSGSNPYAVSPEPISTNYSSASPAQTSVAIFQSGGAQAFDLGQHWTSTEISATNARYQSISDGSWSSTGKDNARFVRAIRKVAI